MRRDVRRLAGGLLSGGDAMSNIEPRHHSMMGKRRLPRGLDRVTITDEQRVAIQSIALDVFATCANAGLSLQEILAAVYLTGLENGASAEQLTAVRKEIEG